MANNSIQELIKAKIAKNTMATDHKPENISNKLPNMDQTKILLGNARESKGAFVENRFSRPTLLKNPGSKPQVEKAQRKVAEAHTTLTRATVHADFERQAQAHRTVKLGFTRTPRMISKLLN